MIEVGLSYTSTMRVETHSTAEAMGSGDLPVFATPALAALMENAAMRAVAAELPDDATTVGTRLELNHVKVSGVGAEVTAAAVLTAVDGRRLTFRIEAHDGQGLVGECTHERFIVDRKRFLEKIAISN